MSSFTSDSSTSVRSETHHSRRSRSEPCSCYCRRPFPNLQIHSQALHTAAEQVRWLQSKNWKSACMNATILSHLLAQVVERLDGTSRDYWCQMMDGLVMRKVKGDVNFHAMIAPGLMGEAEHIFARNVERGEGCGGEFAWVDEGGIGGFEGYVGDVLNEEGRKMFWGEVEWRTWWGGEVSGVSEESMTEREWEEESWAGEKWLHG